MQKRFTRILPGMEGCGYKDRFNRLGLLSVESRRLSRNLIVVYKIMRGIDRVDSQSFLPRLRWGVAI